jgi:hypothetical protein
MIPFIWSFNYMNFRVSLFQVSIPSRVHQQCVTRRHFSPWNKRRRRRKEEEEKRIRFSFQQRTAAPSRPVPVICEADKAKARIKKLIAEEATGEMRSAGSTCTVASGLSCSTISGKKAGMSAPVKLALRPCHFLPRIRIAADRFTATGWFSLL